MSNIAGRIQENSLAIKSVAGRVLLAGAPVYHIYELTHKYDFGITDTIPIILTAASFVLVNDTIRELNDQVHEFHDQVRSLEDRIEHTEEN
jgi:hypothetical protein